MPSQAQDFASEKAKPQEIVSNYWDINPHKTWEIDTGSTLLYVFKKFRGPKVTIIDRYSYLKALLDANCLGLHDADFHRNFKGEHDAHYLVVQEVRDELREKTRGEIDLDQLIEKLESVLSPRASVDLVL